MSLAVRDEGGCIWVGGGAAVSSVPALLPVPVSLQVNPRQAEKDGQVKTLEQ
jgi:hypothetical protein